MDGLDEWVAAEGILWVSFGVAIVALGIVILFQAGKLPSLRLSRSEEKAVLAGPRGDKRRAALRASRVPRKKSSWNALVDSQDGARIHVQALASRRRRWILALALFVSALLIAAVVATTAREIDNIITSNAAGPFVVARFFGLIFAAGYGWLAIPTLTQWLLMRIERSRTPLEWRLLKASSPIGWIAKEPSSKWGAHERPRDGAISIPKARQLLRRIEAEVVETLSLPAGALPSDKALWRKRVAPRLTMVVESKARLLDARNDSVPVGEILAWMDELVEVLVFKKETRSIQRVELAPDLLDGSAVKRAKTILELRFWRSSAAMLLLLSTILFSSIALSVLLPASESFLSENPRLTDALAGIVGIALTGIVTYIVSMAVRARSR